MRALYTAAWWAAMPLVVGRLWWRGRREPGYREHVGERLAVYGRTAVRAQAGGRIIWIHAVSVGETRAAQPLVQAFLERDPGCTILLTHMTPTGRATGRDLFARYGARVVQCYLPYDTGWMTRRFLQRFRPAICILMETEVWPNLIAQCRREKVPVALVNGRLSERSLRRAQRLSGLMAEAAQGIHCVGAQTEADAERFRLLGGNRVAVTGSIKFDVLPPSDMVEKGLQWRRQIGARPVLLCASTREGEEEMILDALQLAPLDDALVLLVPRHPQRFGEVAAMAQARGMALQRRSALGDAPLDPQVSVLLGDSMGEMFAYYAACDVAFVGGSLLPLGGQNLIEACALGKPVLTGPYTFNFATITEDAVAAGAALRVKDAGQMVEEALRLLRNEAARMAMGQDAAEFARRHRGATERTLDLLLPLTAS